MFISYKSLLSPPSIPNNFILSQIIRFSHHIVNPLMFCFHPSIFHDLEIEYSSVIAPVLAVYSWIILQEQRCKWFPSGKHGLNERGRTEIFGSRVGQLYNCPVLIGNLTNCELQNHANQGHIMALMADPSFGRDPFSYLIARSWSWTMTLSNREDLKWLHFGDKSLFVSGAYKMDETQEREQLWIHYND